jgi:hypothetical protein
MRLAPPRTLQDLPGPTSAKSPIRPVEQQISWVSAGPTTVLPNNVLPRRWGVILARLAPYRNALEGLVSNATRTVANMEISAGSVCAHSPGHLAMQ